MACRDVKYDPLTQDYVRDVTPAEASCKCKTAVIRAYKTLVGSGHPSTCALSAAKIVYAHHHPEDCKGTAAITVEQWVNKETGKVH